MFVQTRGDINWHEKRIPHCSWNPWFYWVWRRERDSNPRYPVGGTHDFQSYLGLFRTSLFILNIP